MLLVFLPALAFDPEAHVPTAARCAPDTVDLALYLDTRLAIAGVTFGAVSAQRSCLVGEPCGVLHLTDLDDVEPFGPYDLAWRCDTQRSVDVHCAAARCTTTLNLDGKTPIAPFRGMSATDSAAFVALVGDEPSALGAPGSADLPLALLRADLEALSATCAVFPCGVVPQVDDLVPGWTVTRATPMTPVGKTDRLGVRLDLDNPSRRAQATLWCWADDRDSGENLGWGCTLELLSGRGRVRVVHDDDVLSYTDETGAVATIGSRWSRTGGAAGGWPAGIHDP